MHGQAGAWARWIALFVVLGAGIRTAIMLALPILPDSVVWGGTVLLSASLMLLFVPLPHEATLATGQPDGVGPDGTPDPPV